jgi:outer membrane protein OmpA-like peptidoglycan-associated protein
MKRSLIITAFFFCTVLLLHGQDAPGSSDHTLFPRMKGFRIVEFDITEPATYKFYDEGGVEMAVSGRLLYYYYESETDLTPSKILAGVSAPLKAKGARMCSHDDNKLCMIIQQEDVEVWADLSAGDFYYTLRIIEKAEIDQKVTAETIAGDFATVGETVLYIRFNYRGSDIQPYSTPSVEALITALKGEGAAKIEIEGHTDSEGSEAENRRISLERSVALADELIKGGIERGRIVCTGLGEGKPVADTESTRGKALNRRMVVRVKKQ